MARKVDHLSKVTRTSEALRRAQDARDQAVVDALAAGESLRTVAKASGLSPEGVRKVAARLAR